LYKREGRTGRSEENKIKETTSLGFIDKKVLDRAGGVTQVVELAQGPEFKPQYLQPK
jgi:hypothetical protein